MQATKESPASHTLAGDKATDQLKESMLNSEGIMRLYHQTATATLMSALTATPANGVLDVAEGLQPGDWPTAAHQAIWQAVVTHCHDLAEAGHPGTVPSVEIVSATLQRSGHLNDQNTRALLLDAVGTVRGGRALPADATAQLAAILRRHRLRQVLADTAQALQAAANGSDADVQRAMNYVQHLPRYIQRAGVNVE